MENCRVTAAKRRRLECELDTCFIVPGFGVKGGQPSVTSVLLKCSRTTPNILLVIMTNYFNYILQRVQYVFVCLKAKYKGYFTPGYMLTKPNKKIIVCSLYNV